MEGPGGNCPRSRLGLEAMSRYLFVLCVYYGVYQLLGILRHLSITIRGAVPDPCLRPTYCLPKHPTSRFSKHYVSNSV